MPSLFYAGQPDYIEKLNTLATAASMTNGTVAASFLSLAVTGTATAASFVGPLTGNASTATTLATARNINGVAFNGSADITVTAAAGTLTGATLAAGVTASSLTSVGTLAALTVSGTSTLGVTRASAADGAITFGVAGTTRGVRIFTSSYGTAIEGVDNTLGASYQPLNIVASALGLYTTGGSAIALGTSSGTPQMYVTNTTSAVNYATITGSATGNAVAYGVAGTDANIGLSVNTKGTGSHFFRTNGGAQTQLEVVHVASAVNRLQIGGAATAGSPYLIADGSDTNINIYYGAKGSGSHAFASGAGLIQFQVNHVASAVNQWIVQGGATGQSPLFFATGSDTNVSAGFSLKGAGNFSFYTGTTTATQLIITHTASTVNAMTLTGSTTGQPTRIGNFGSDANPDILIAPQGTGVLRFGTHSALAAETVTGYITIKDAAGNSRKLAVVS